ncbi:NAD(P)/FAD-dependent oxidoreductase [Sinanaerobacter sp. ZZT-01]|uniref:NAD(P)/FAD-dependent oxidoreductase n=1 Tax=Sinanaerobacter sp. ZZT-01 TaxID=3111540 RepID=UPI002D79D00B|nr:NAD(P)/FAD-dependent oxidoreductase [Sinanaerobacter sp. ZZT-01]WRR93521.1 NAD(P)/FAD-dependent oxidoreductase [Sinanaerobacter sp. ZZT-01]
MQKEKKCRWKIMIVGGGASGMMAAIAAARSTGKGNEILLLEKNTLLGKKLLATGNGRCNFMNKYCTPYDLRGQEEVAAAHEKKEKIPFSFDILSQLDVSRTEEIFLQMGVLSREEAEGRIYPYSGQGAIIKEALEAEIQQLGICVRASSNVKNIRKNGDFFKVDIDDSTCFFSEKVILSTGGKAGLQYGSTGEGYVLAKEFGHHIVKPIPALVPLLCDKKSFGGCKGVRAKGKVRLLCEGAELAVDTGEIQFTEEGISGICVFNISRFVRFKSLDELASYEVEIDLFPNFSEAELLDILIEKQKRESEHSMSLFLKGLIHEKLAAALLNRSQIKKEEAVYRVTESKIKELTFLMKHWNLKLAGTKSFKEAQVTCGGISVEEIDPKTLESLLVPGLYFAGELIDVDGRCGGFNLQWAWSSGYGAGKAAAKE